MKKVLQLTLLLSTLFAFSNAHSALVDKIAGVINDKVFTLSEVKRISSTVGIRKEIAPFIYTQPKYTTKEMLRVLQNSFIVKDKLEELGFVVSDDSVQDRIAQTEKGLGLNREELLRFLNSKGITFNEYFEILRSAMEYNIFNRRIIAPLVTITDQEMKNYYYKQYSSAKASSFKYNVIDFNIASSKVQKEDRKQFKEILEKYRKTGTIPQIYSSLSTDELGKISGEDVPKNLREILKNTDESSFSEVFIDDGILHVFFIESREIADSQDFLRKKRDIYNAIFLERSQKLSESWFSRESLNYYILTNI